MNNVLVLQGIREYQSDTFDDWRDLLEEQERRTRDELDGSKVRCQSARVMQPLRIRPWPSITSSICVLDFVQHQV